MNKVANDEKTVKLTRYIITLIISVLVGFILLAVVYLLPVAPMRANVEQSYDMLEKEGISSDMIKGFDSTRLDNYSDGLILNSAIYEGNESVLNKAAAVYQYNQNNGNYYTALLTMLKGGSEGLEKGSYARDWHGYLVIIKPLLLFMNYGEIILLNMFLQIMLVMSVVMAMDKAGLKKYIPGYGISLFFLSWATISFSLEFSVVFYIFNISSLVLLKHFDELEKNGNIPLLFMLTGVCVSYMDVLTYPIVSLGIPMIFYFLMKRDEYSSIKNTINKILNLGVCWSFGYLGMWGGKWIIASMFTGKNVLKEAILMVLYRMSGESSDSGTLVDFGYMDILKRNFGVYAGTPYIICLVVLAIAAIYFILKYKTNFDIRRVLPLVTVGCMPLIWYFLVKNHSYVHYWMTHRDIVLIVFSLYCIIAEAITTNKRKI